MSSYNRAFLLDILLLTPAATTPTYATPGSAGLDLYSSHDSIVYGYGRTLISTGISVALPPNCYGRIAGRSGLALTKGLMVGAGVIDPDFRGEIQVLLFNLSKNDYSIKRGDKIAQLITEQCRLVEPVVRLSLPDTGSSRGIQGFGSSDRKSPKADGFTAAHMVNNNPPGFEDFPYLSVYMDDKIETFVGNTHNNHPSRAAGVINDVMRKTQPDSSCSSGENSDSDVSKPSPAPLLDFAAGNATPTRAAKLDAYGMGPLTPFQKHASSMMDAGGPELTRAVVAAFFDTTGTTEGAILSNAFGWERIRKEKGYSTTDTEIAAEYRQLMDHRGHNVDKL